MRKRPSLVFVAIVAAVVAFAAGMFPRSALAEGLPELAAQAKPSVVLITLYDAAGHRFGTGTGFVVSADGRVVTNHHVIDDAAAAKAKTADGREVDVAGILADDPARDIAIVKLAGEGYVPLPLGESASLREGDEVVVIGSPLGLSQSLSTGIVAAVRAKGVGGNWDEPSDQGEGGSWGIQITAPISPGSSGSPVMTRSGEVVAVAVGQMVRGQSLNFAIPVEVAKDLLNGLGPLAQPASFSKGEKSHSLRNLLISLAFFGSPVLAWFGWKRYDARRAANRRGRFRAS